MKNQEQGFTNIFNAYSRVHAEPSLEKIAMDYSKDAALFYLRFHVSETFMFLNIFNSTPIGVIKDVCNILFKTAPKMLLNDFLVFCERVKAGRFGKISSAHDFCIAFNKAFYKVCNENV